MHHIVYTSRALTRMNDEDLEYLCQKSTNHNSKIGITGILVYDGVGYMHLIEGEEVAVRNLMVSIAADRRHDRIVYRFDEPVNERAFKEWGLKCIGFKNTSTTEQFLREVKELVANVKNPNVVAGFIGFAFLARRGIFRNP